MEPELPQSQRLTKEQKTGFVLLLIFALLAVTLGFVQMRHTIHKPFFAKLDKEASATNRLIEDDATRLQKIDTDRDGLNDYEELSLYETSPYLPDTDSDGTPDKKEIERGTDPACAEGSTCATAADSASQPGDPVVEAPLGLDTITPETIIGGEVNTTLGAEGAVSIGQIQSLIQDPKALRELLLKSGSIPKADLEKIDDKTLLELAQQLFAEQLKGGVGGSGSVSPGQ